MPKLDPCHPPEPTPALFLDTINAYQETAALKAAIELNLFTEIGPQPATAQELGHRCRASERGIRILCDNLVVLGFLTKSAMGYSLTRDSAVFLDRKSSACLAGTIQFLLSPKLTGGFDRLADAVRQGGTVLEDEGTVTPDHPVWVDFARSMAPLMMVPAERAAELVITDPKQLVKVLDVAAGHGFYGIHFARRHPSAQIVALDWPNVLAVAQRNAQSFGVADRFRALPGDAFTVDFGMGYDFVLLPNFLHHFAPPTCVQLLKKVYAALNPGGKAITVEFIPNADRVSPPNMASAFALTMLASTPAGDAYIFSEYETMFRDAGFRQSTLHPLPPTAQNAVIAQK